MFLPVTEDAPPSPVVGSLSIGVNPVKKRFLKSWTSADLVLIWGIGN